MFQFPSLACMPYGFRHASSRITTSGFPHSEIPGSLTGQRLPGAYRSRPRPSSPLGAKASTVCPCSLDRKNSGNRCRYGVFKVHASSGPPHGEERKPAAVKPAGPRLSKLSSKRDIEVDIVLGEPIGRTDKSINGIGAHRHELPASLERR